MYISSFGQSIFFAIFAGTRAEVLIARAHEGSVDQCTGGLILVHRQRCDDVQAGTPAVSWSSRLSCGTSVSCGTSGVVIGTCIYLCVDHCWAVAGDGTFLPVIDLDVHIWSVGTSFCCICCYISMMLYCLPALGRGRTSYI